MQLFGQIGGIQPGQPGPGFSTFDVFAAAIGLVARYAEVGDLLAVLWVARYRSRCNTCRGGQPDCGQYHWEFAHGRLSLSCSE
jgi:hypothetical protein